MVRAFSGSLPVGGKPIDVVTADFDGDQLADLAVSNSKDGTVTLLFGCR